MSKKKETKKMQETWNDIRGIIRVWGQKFDGNMGSYLSFSTSIGHKNEDDEYDNYYLRVRFSKELRQDLKLGEGATILDVSKAFLSCEAYTKGKGKHAEDVVQPVLVITDAEIADEDPDEDKPKKSKKSKKDEDEDEDDEDDLPF